MIQCSDLPLEASTCFTITNKYKLYKSVTSKKALSSHYLQAKRFQMSSKKTKVHYHLTMELLTMQTIKPKLLNCCFLSKLSNIEAKMKLHGGCSYSMGV
ncbi:unnamed protein product [Coffea canephora]|uniref:Uncharacterized protein n=1 Tax=Coffea canephora TaxID=49390 RepID=A0A068TY58_COFCA|nr:unnamed protein product [Coffea canephora]